MDVALRIIGDAILRTIDFKQLDPWSIQVDNRLNLIDKPAVHVIAIFDVHSNAPRILYSQIPSLNHILRTVKPNTSLPDDSISLRVV